MLHQTGCVGQRQLRVEIHTHLGELYAHVGIQVLLRDGIEQAVIDSGSLLSFFG